MMTDTQQQQAEELIEGFSLFDENEDKLHFLIDLGRQLPPMDAVDKTEEHLIPGCRNKVWVVAHPRQEGSERVIDYVLDSEAAFAKGMGAILWRVFSGQPPEKIVTFDTDHLFEGIEMDRWLSSLRTVGIHSMVQKMKTLAASLAS